MKKIDLTSLLENTRFLDNVEYQIHKEEDPKYYIAEHFITIQTSLFPENDDETIICIGKAVVYEVLYLNILEDQFEEPLFDIMHWHSRTFEELIKDIGPRKLQKLLHESIFNNITYLHNLKIVAPLRKFGIGKYLLSGLCHMFTQDFIIGKAYPMNSRHMPTGELKKAAAKLKAYWLTIGLKEMAKNKPYLYKKAEDVITPPGKIIEHITRAIQTIELPDNIMSPEIQNELDEAFPG